MKKILVPLGVATVMGFTAQVSTAQVVGGSVVNSTTMKNSLIVSGAAGLTGGRGSVINSVLVGPKGQVKGSIVNTTDMKNALIVADGGSTINSVAIGVPR